MGFGVPCTPYVLHSEIQRSQISELGLILLTKNEQRRRECCLFSIDVHFPKLDVAGSIPVSRSFFQQFMLQCRYSVTPKRSNGDATICQNFELLNLKQVCRAIAYYLVHKADVDAYLIVQDQKWADGKAKFEAVPSDLPRLQGGRAEKSWRVPGSSEVGYRKRNRRTPAGLVRLRRGGMGESARVAAAVTCRWCACTIHVENAHEQAPIALLCFLFRD